MNLKRLFKDLDPGSYTNNTYVEISFDYLKDHIIPIEKDWETMKRYSKLVAPQFSQDLGKALSTLGIISWGQHYQTMLSLFMSYPSLVYFGTLEGKINTLMVPHTHPMKTPATQQTNPTQIYMKGHVSPTKGIIKSTYKNTN